ncbi:hypothetical protein [Nostoc sp. TCL26-01]|uniref:hypothetical protein n=1 Tax=Nostoc sp. TCL26-01 TaxID=2576904 RepID=UPI0015B82729|nr:hypothetical protein [Nostoc sp. TCL26-01]
MPILYMLSVAISVALLWQISLVVKNNNQGNNLTDINNGDCLMIKSNTGMQLYCSKP